MPRVLPTRCNNNIEEEEKMIAREHVIIPHLTLVAYDIRQFRENNSFNFKSYYHVQYLTFSKGSVFI